MTIDPGPVPIAGICRFGLLTGRDPAAPAAAARATDTRLAARPGHLHPNLSQREAGGRSDVALRADLAMAHDAAPALMADPVAAPFAGLIDPAGVEIRPELLRMAR